MAKAHDIFDSVDGFQWDSGNISKSMDRHRVTSLECEEVFFNSPLLSGEDEKHSASENRHYVLGTTDRNRLLFIVFTLRGSKIRVISARDMNRKERKIYETHTEETA